jgi:hypothetical protein
VQTEEHLQIVNSVFEGNHGKGQAVIINSLNNQRSTIDISNSTFRNNTGVMSLISLVLSNLKVDNVKFFYNYCATYSNGISSIFSELDISNSIIQNDDFQNIP